MVYPLNMMRNQKGVILITQFFDRYKIVGRSSTCSYQFVHDSIKDKHLVVIPFSKSEYIIRRYSNNCIVFVDRDEVIMARVNRYSQIKIGEVVFSMHELLNMKKGQNVSACINQNIGYNECSIDPKKTIIIGASNQCEITIPTSRLKWRHYKLINNNNQWYLQPFRDQLKKVEKIAIENNKPISLAGFNIRLNNNVFRISPETKTSLELSNLEVVNSKEKYLIHNISIHFKKEEFIGIIGPSGAGKSVLLKSIRGIIPARRGKIFVNEQNVFENKELYKEIGFIPQDDVVHQELTVFENLWFAAKLRLPNDWPSNAIKDKVLKMLDQLYIMECKDRPISEISGGQRKRLNLATEMILEPSIILADEVCSGLSSWDTDNIVKLLRKIANSGKVVLLTIHTPDIETLDAMDKLLVLDKGGYLAYYGPAQPDAIQYFSSAQYTPNRSPKMIFDVLEKQQPNGNRQTEPETWNEIYRNSIFYKKYIEKGLEFK